MYPALAVNGWTAFRSSSRASGPETSVGEDVSIWNISLQRFFLSTIDSSETNTTRIVRVSCCCPLGSRSVIGKTTIIIRAFASQGDGCWSQKLRVYIAERT